MDWFLVPFFHSPFFFWEVRTHGWNARARKLSGYPPERLPQNFFLKRNRLIAALSDELYAIDTEICDAEKKLDFKECLEYL